MKKVVVIGGGAAGLMAAGVAGSDGNAVTVLERNERPARKVMITGKGRCNVTNNSDIAAHINAANRNGKFLYSALSSFSPADTVSFFESRGVPLKTERGNRVFPCSDKAVDIVDALVKYASQNAKTVNARAVKINTENGAVKSVKTEDGREFLCDAVILATGGKSYPLTGSSGDGYKMAEALGHTVTPLSPCLVGVECHEGFCTRLQGLSLKNIGFTVYAENAKKPCFSDFGELMFTHYGISGPVVLTASAKLTPEKNKYKAYIDLKPALDAQTLDRRILRDFSENTNKNFANSLGALLPQKLISVIVTLSGIAPECKVNSVTKEQRARLVALLKALPLNITALRPIEEAVVTRGGINVREIEASTMRSRLIDGLYFAGEIIDTDSRTGGFNLQAAFSTGALAGKLK